MWLVNISLSFLVGFLCVQRSECATAGGIVSYARSHINSHTWLDSSSHETGPGTNKCHIFVADVLKHEGADAPNSLPIHYTPIGAGEWGNPRSNYLTDNLCWKLCALPAKSPGDIISDGVHVGIVTDINITTSASVEATPRGLVVENEWGFGETDNSTCWRYHYSKLGC